MYIEDTPIELFDAVPAASCDDSLRILGLAQELANDEEWVGSPLLAYKNEEEEIQLILPDKRYFAVGVLKQLLDNPYYKGAGGAIIVPILILEEDEIEDIQTVSEGELPTTTEDWYEAFKTLELEEAATAVLKEEEG